MSLQSEKVKRWRKATKSRLLAGMGGACYACGYSKCEAALDFHHIDPAQKDFGLGAARASIKSWDKLVEEVEKCVILCTRCHREHHEGMLEIIFQPNKFDEKLKNYKESQKEELYDKCPVCSKKKSKHLINCSLECAGKARRKIDWSSVDLKNLYGKKTIIQIAEELGVSDGAVHKRLKKLGLK